MKFNIIIIGLLYLAVLCSYLLMLIPYDTFVTITKEDNLIESIGAIFFLLSAILFFYCYILSKENGQDFWRIKTNRNIFFLFLGIIFFFAFGEEISWGQRIFGWGSPEIMEDVNRQRETNIHNLNFFMYNLSFERIFNLFWMTYCLLIPILNKYSGRMRKLFNGLNLPIVPIWAGLLLLFNYILIHIIQYLHIYETQRMLFGALEIKETNFAFIIFTFALFWTVQKYYKKI